jgi:hypothetical protein
MKRYNQQRPIYWQFTASVLQKIPRCTRPILTHAHELRISAVEVVLFLGQLGTDGHKSNHEHGRAEPQPGLPARQNDRPWLAAMCPAIFAVRSGFFLDYRKFRGNMQMIEEGVALQPVA